ncbi:MAG: hypothetical protein KG029_19445, partial [Bacteroidetes bacterium]|nr:hypothetical protein [Bacteroidota bacterium]
ALRSLDKKLEQARGLLVRLQADLLSLEGEIGKAWEHDEAYEKASAELAAINAELDRWSRQQAEKKDGEDQDIDLSIVDNDDGWLEVFESALARIDEMHQQPIAVELTEATIPVTPESIAQARQEIARNQAQLDFMQAVASVPQPLAQMSMFGEVVREKTERRKKR